MALYPVGPRPQKEWGMLLQRKNDVAVGDDLRISVHKKTFDKRGCANFTEKVFQVREKVDIVPF
jgi:hypothetical protein